MIRAEIGFERERLDAAQQENTSIRSEKTQLEARIAGLETEVAKSKSDKSASDTALALQEAELRELRQLREENGKHKRLVADLSLDRHILQEIVQKKL